MCILINYSPIHNELYVSLLWCIYIEPRPNLSLQTGLVSWASTFYIRNVHEDDYGRYECIAENELGASTFTVRFIKPTRPDPPLSLKVGSGDPGGL